MDQQEYINAWEHRVGDQTAHREFRPNGKGNMYAEYEKAIFGENLSGCIIVDWGCGGGLFAEWLFLYHNVGGYVGHDISEKSITAAESRMENYDLPDDTYKFLKVEPKDIDALQVAEADFFICLSVIQHMPDKEYLDNFLKSVNRGKFKTLLLQIRHSEKTVFQDEPYKTTREIALACRTNSVYLKRKLKNYVLQGKSAIAKSGYQYLMFARKESESKKKNYANPRYGIRLGD